jgi:hypothetical protein
MKAMTITLVMILAVYFTVTKLTGTQGPQTTVIEDSVDNTMAAPQHHSEIPL